MSIIVVSEKQSRAGKEFDDDDDYNNNNIAKRLKEKGADG